MNDASLPVGALSDTEAPGQPQHVGLVVAPPTTPPRFGQLTHTNFHPANGDGGWQVKEVTGRITTDEQRLLEKRATGFQPAELSTLRDLLGQSEIDRLPRRLVHGPVDPARPGPTAYWHAVPAGEDSSRRPGNVFTHVVVDREPDAPRPPLRPSDLLRSPWWLRPYGADQVRAASVEGRPDPPWPDPVLDRAAVLAFLKEKALWRAGTLRGLLDAVHAAMQGGPTVVLGVEAQEDADCWVAAVCHLMSPGTSRRFCFSTAEHTTGLAAARTAGLHLIVVPAAELRTVEPDDTVALISDEDLPDGEPAVEFVDYDTDDDTEQVHTTSFGSRIRATPWSMIVAAILRDPALAAELLDRQDAVAAELGDRDLGGAWPLALAVVEYALGDPGTTATDVLDEALPAARMVAQNAPYGVVGISLRQIVRRLQEQVLGRTAAEAWAALQDEAPRAMDARSARTVYLQRAIRDRHWLLRDGGAPAPDMLGMADQVEDTIVVQAHATLGQLRADGRSDTESAAVALRLLDLVARAGLAGHLESARIADALDKVVGPVLLHAVDGPELVGRVGQFGEDTQAGVVRPWLDRLLPQLPGRPGSRVAPLVLRWLFPEPPAPPPAGSVPPATLVEAAAQASLVLPDRSAFRAVALTADLATPGGPTTRAALGPGLPVDAVLALLDRVEPHRLVDVLTPALLSAPAGPDLDGLVQRLRSAVDQPTSDTPAGRAIQAACELRILEVSWQRPPDGNGEREPMFRRFARSLRAQVEAGGSLDGDLLLSGGAADVVDHIEGIDDAAPPLLARQHRPAAAWADADAMLGVARRVAHAVRAGAVPDLRVVLAAQLGGQAFGGTPLGPASWHVLSDLCWTSPSGRTQRLIDHVVWLRLPQLRRERPDEPDRVVAEARDWVVRAADEQGDRLDRHRVLVEYDRAALRWWRRLGVDDDTLRVLRRRRWRES